MESSTTALSLYEKYTQLNHQLDEAREQRVVLQKCVEETQDRLQQYATQDKPAILKSTQAAKDEYVTWQAELDKGQEELLQLQNERSALTISRNQLMQEVSAKQEQRRMDCRNFLAESRSFRQRQCPRLLLQLGMLPSGESSFSTDAADRVTRLWAVAMANGWDAAGLPETGGLQHVQKKSNFDGLETFPPEDIEWDLWDAALEEDDNDDEETRQLLQEYREQRQLVDDAKVDLGKAKQKLENEEGSQYQACLQRKEQLETQLLRLTKEIQQLEVDISTTLAFHDFEEDAQVEVVEESDVEESPPNSSSVPPQSGNRVSLSPPTEVGGVTNPYERRAKTSTQTVSNATTARFAATSTSVRPPPRRPGTTPAAHPNPLRSRHGSSRKRKVVFGSSMEIGGAERHPSDHGTRSSFVAEMLSGLDDDDGDDDELLLPTPSSRKKK